MTQDGFFDKHLLPRPSPETGEAWALARKDLGKTFARRFDILKNNLRQLPPSIGRDLLLYQAYPINEKGGAMKFSAKDMAEFEIQYREHYMVGGQQATAPGSISRDNSISGHPTDEPDPIDVFNLLSAVVLAGNRAEVWSLPVPSINLRLSREKSSISPPAAIEADKGHQYRTIFLRCLCANKCKARGCAELTPHVKLGRLIVAAVLFGGLLDKNLVRGLCRATGKKLLLFEHHAWIDIVAETQQGLRLHSRRWLPDPLSETLMVTDPVTSPAEWSDPDWLWTSERINEVLNAFFQTYGWDKKDRPASFTQLINAATHLAAFELPAYARGFAMSNPPSASLRPASWYRLIGAVPPVALSTEPDARPSPEDAHTDNDHGLDKRTHPLISGLRDALAENKKQRMTTTLEDFLETSNPEFPIQRRLVEWVQHLLLHGSKRGASVNPGGVVRHLSNVGARLLNIAGPLDPMGLDEEDRETFTDSILETAIGDSNRRSVAQSLSEFWAFVDYSLETSSGFPGIQNAIRQFIPVDASIVTPGEFEIALELLDQSIVLRRLHPLARAAARLLVVFGYRLGLRRSEAFYLRLGDFIQGERPELLVRPYKERGLKSAASRRKLPLYALLSERELNWVTAWLDRELEGHSSAHKDQAQKPFFLTACPIDESSLRQIYDEIREALREASGDENARYHWLRHSFGSKLAFGMLFDKTVAETDSGMPSSLLGWTSEGQSVRRIFFPGESSSRKYLYWISSLLGHSSPAVSLRHYIHSGDLLLHRELARSSWKMIDTASVMVAAGAPDKTAIHAIFQHKTSLHDYVYRLRHQSVSTSYEIVSPASGNLRVTRSVWHTLRQVDAVLWKLARNENLTQAETDWFDVDALTAGLAALAKMKSPSRTRSGGISRHRFEDGVLRPVTGMMELVAAKDAAIRWEQLLVREAKSPQLSGRIDAALRIYVEHISLKSHELRFNHYSESMLLIDFLLDELFYTASQIYLTLEYHRDIRESLLVTQHRQWLARIDRNGHRGLEIKIKNAGKNAAKNTRLVVNLRLDRDISSLSEGKILKKTSNPSIYGFRWVMSMMFIYRGISGSRKGV